MRPGDDVNTASGYWNARSGQASQLGKSASHLTSTDLRDANRKSQLNSGYVFMDYPLFKNHPETGEPEGLSVYRKTDGDSRDGAASKPLIVECKKKGREMESRGFQFHAERLAGYAWNGFWWRLERVV